MLVWTLSCDSPLSAQQWKEESCSLFSPSSSRSGKAESVKLLYFLVPHSKHTLSPRKAQKPHPKLFSKVWYVHFLTSDIKAQRIPCNPSGTPHAGFSSLSETAAIIPLLPQIIPLSPFTGEMLILKALSRMDLSVVNLSCAHQLSSSEWWHCHSSAGRASAAKGTQHPLEEPKLLHQWWCNHDERFEGHLSSCLAPWLEC